MRSRKREGRRAGRSSRAPSLGATDPRWDRDARRNAHVQDLDERTMQRDEFGRMSAIPVDLEATEPTVIEQESVIEQLSKIKVNAIQNLAGTATSAERIAAINDILKALRAAGIQV